MIKLITFTDDRMTISAQRCVESAMRNGAEAYSVWVPHDLSDEFKRLQEDLLKDERGFGWWCWKPYIVNEEMMNADDGDILVYCDAGNEWVGDMRQAIAAMDQDILFFSNGWRHMDWCKMDTAFAILHDSDESFESEQVQASTFFIRVTPETRKFIKEWYAWSLMPGMISNEPSMLPNVATFQEHRHDQAILCCLQIKYGYRLYWFPTTTARHLQADFPNDKYPVLLNHHRKRNNEW